MGSPHRLVILLLVTGLSAACADGALTSPRNAGGLAVTVAPLTLPGVTDADYTLTVYNAAGGAAGDGEIVWQRAGLTSRQYGDGGGSLSYVGTCDADAGTNSVTLDLTALYAGNGVPIATETYMNPTPLTLDVACAANEDTPVVFDITIARAANQGFFDVAVSFDDIFCSAKLDCVRSGTSDDLELLHRGDGTRDLTAVLGFACTADTAVDATRLYINDPVIHCANHDTDEDVTFDISGVGNVALAAEDNPGGYLFGAAVYRGIEQLANKAYWNIAFGLDETRFGALGPCTLTAEATATDFALTETADGFVLPPDRVYPTVTWQVDLSDASGRLCESHALNDDTGVEIAYVGYLSAPNTFVWDTAPRSYRHGFNAATQIVESALGCVQGCVHGTCEVGGVCTCEAGWAGADCGAEELLQLTSATEQPGVPVELGGVVYFSARSVGTGTELWRSDGTLGGTSLVADIYPGAGNSGPGWLTAFDGTLYFAARTAAEGTELWRSDGTPAGTTLVADIVSGGGSSTPQYMRGVGDWLYFQANDGVTGQELWRSDGTVTVQVADIREGSGGSAARPVAVVGDVLYLLADDGVVGRELWKTTAGSSVVELVGDYAPSVQAVYNGELYFQGNDGVTGEELWRTDAALGAVQVADIRPGSASSAPGEGLVVGGYLYFAATDATSGRELWRTDGTTTTRVADIYPGSSSSYPQSFVDLDGLLLFMGLDATHGQELWRSDGTTSGTALVKDIRPASSSGPGNFNAVTDTEVFFTADDGTHGKELWRSDGTEAGTQLVVDLAPGAANSNARTSLYSSTLGMVFFTADDGTHGPQLWRYVPTP